MATLLPGYAYDVFISYRHNDNRADGWVSTFVQQLKYELEATVKDKLSVYFDANPTDGLSDLADVDRSLGDKINALILIPIISQTYCDQRSFAWQHEFVAFKENAQSDAFGLYARLANGNYVSRMLPIRIHDLEHEDVQLLERELQGHLRSIDFVYNHAGVNRPLLLADPAANGTSYRNQINKVANAIKDLTKALRWAHEQPGTPMPETAGPRVQHASTAFPAYAPTEGAAAGGKSVAEASYTTTLRGAAPATDKRPKVFLAWASKDLAPKRDELAIVLQKAGIDVVPSTDAPSDDDTFRARAQEALAVSECSIHLMSHQFGRRFEDDDALSFPAYQYQKAIERHTPDGAYKSFVWFTPEDGQPVMGAQQALMNEIRNGLTEHIVFSTVQNAVQIVDDIRDLLIQNEEPLLPTKDTDIFFIYNELDSEAAEFITEQLARDIPVEVLAIEAESEQMYREFTVQQIPKSRLAVVYFKDTSAWALPFVKQVWKLVGGASSGTPILMLADSDPATNKLHRFKAPGVTSVVTPANTMKPTITEAYQQASLAVSQPTL
jgi:hypothetical protein